MSNIKCVKLISGDEIIADVSEFDDGNLVVLSKPIGLAPFCPYAKDNIVPIRGGAIVSIFDPETGMLNEYNTRYGSGLVVPESKIII
jgi:hypothetical protein